MNKFEQVSGLDHQRSLAGGDKAWTETGDWDQGVPCMVRSKASWVMITRDPSCEQIDTHD